MRDRDLEGAAWDDLRAGVRVSTLSIVWTLLSSAAAIAIGAAANSLVLIAFGLTGLFDAAGSVALVVHFRHALHHDQFSARHEKLSLRVITFGLLTVGLLTGSDSIWRLIERADSRSAPAGLVVAALSLVILTVLAARKRRVAARIPSRALLADGRLSATGALLAAVTLTGTGLESAFGWWWVDPVAAAAIACGAVVVGALTARATADALG